MKLKSFAILSSLSLSLVVGCTTLQNTTPPQSATAAPIATIATPTLTANSTSPQLNPEFDRGLIFTTANGIAINGTDPVAYFTEQRPVPGSSEFSHNWMGATWHFSSAANRDRFAANPEQYAPQYGGYCAFAVANNYTASTIPEAWNIIDGKLYLNFDLNVRDRWSQDIPSNITKANANWPNALKDFRR